jgi:hypothetical protein
MGHVKVPLRTANPSDESQAVEVEALVSNARVHVLLPVELAMALSLPGVGTGEAFARVSIDAHQGIAGITLIDSGQGAVVGSLGLAALGLRLDASNEALVEAENLLMAVG